MTTTRVRRARKQHDACGGYCRPIAPGELYVEHVAYPGDDAMDGVTRPWRLRECARCARRYGRGHLLNPAGAVRIRRQRTRGWRMPPNASYVGRPTVFGNPFRVDVPYCGPTIRTPRTVGETVDAFRLWLQEDTLPPLMWDRELVAAHALIKGALQAGQLAGKNLACWCPLSAPCHADVLLEHSNLSPPPATLETRPRTEETP